MNYLAQLRAFDDWLESNQVATSAIALWYALMMRANKSGWQEWFSVSILTLQAKTGLGRTAVYAARNSLRQLGRVEFRDRKGRQSSEYRLCPFNEHKSIQNHDTPVTESIHNPEPLNKLNVNETHYDDDTRTRKDGYGDEEAQRLRLAISEVEQSAAGIGLPVAGRDIETINLLIAEYSTPWVLEAIERTADRPATARSWGYVKGILRNWREKGAIDDAGMAAGGHGAHQGRQGHGSPVASQPDPYAVEL